MKAVLAKGAVAGGKLMDTAPMKLLSDEVSVLNTAIKGSVLAVPKLASFAKKVDGPLGVIGDAAGVVTGIPAMYKDVRAGGRVDFAFDSASTAVSALSLASKLKSMENLGLPPGLGGGLSIGQTVFHAANAARQGHYLEALSEGTKAFGQGAMGVVGATLGGPKGFDAGVSVANVSQAILQAGADKFLVPYLTRKLDDPTSWVSRVSNFLPQ